MKPRILPTLLLTAGLLALGTGAANASDAFSARVHVRAALRPVVHIGYGVPSRSSFHHAVHGVVFLPRIVTGWRPLYPRPVDLFRLRFDHGRGYSHRSYYHRSYRSLSCRHW